MYEFQGIKILSTSDWNAAPPRGASKRAYGTDKIIVHHMASPNPPNHWSKVGAYAVAQRCQSIHLRENPTWIDTGQHFSIAIDSTILEGRHGSLNALLKGVCIMGAHCVGQNNQWSIEMEGDYRTMSPSDVQLQSLVDLSALIDYKGHIQSRDIYGHRDFRNTICPGDKLYALLPQVRNSVHDRILELKAEEGKAEEKSVLKAVFTMPVVPLQSKLVVGTLKITYPDLEGVLKEIEVKATSGAPGWQHPSKIWSRSKGSVPPSSVIKGSYHISLVWSRPSNQSALGARFYSIQPDPIYQLNGTGIRTEIGLHLDANFKYSPGSAGCIVVLPGQEPGWQELIALLDILRLRGYNKIDLEVVYT